MAKDEFFLKIKPKSEFPVEITQKDEFPVEIKQKVEFPVETNPKAEFPVETKPKVVQRSPPALSCLCKICGAPAPNHFHFGGEISHFYFGGEFFSFSHFGGELFSFSKADICQVFRPMLLLLSSLFPAKHSEEEAARMAQVQILMECESESAKVKV